MQCQNSKTLNTLGHFWYPGHSHSSKTVTYSINFSTFQKNYDARLVFFSIFFNLRDGYEKGYNVITVPDCCAAIGQAAHDAAVEYT